MKKRCHQGRCEAFDIVPTEDDAEYVRCVNRGVRVVETCASGHKRSRIVCAEHRSLRDGKMN